LAERGKRFFFGFKPTTRFPIFFFKERLMNKIFAGAIFIGVAAIFASHAAADDVTLTKRSYGKPANTSVATKTNAVTILTKDANVSTDTHASIVVTKDAAVKTNPDTVDVKTSDTQINTDQSGAGIKTNDAEINTGDDGANLKTDDTDTAPTEGE
jgi:hypothetical protein